MTRTRLTWEKFWYGDWKADLALARSSPATRGVWIEVLCFMWHDGIFEHSADNAEWSVICRCTPGDFSAAVEELANFKVCDVALGNGHVTLKSRRLEREHNQREQTRLRVKKHREAASGNGPVTPGVTHNVTPPVTPYARARLEAQRLRGSEAKKKEVATAASADRSTPGHAVPKPILVIADSLDLRTMACKSHHDGRLPEHTLAWLLVVRQMAPDKPGAYFRKLLSCGKAAPEKALAEAKALLAARDDEIAEEYGKPEQLQVPDVLKSGAREKPLAQRKNEAIERLRGGA